MRRGRGRRAPAASSTRAPRMRGTASPATAASACSDSRATTSDRESAPGPRRTPRRPAVGHRQSALRVARRREVLLRPPLPQQVPPRQARSRYRERALARRQQRVRHPRRRRRARQVSAEPGSPVCSSVIVGLPRSRHRGRGPPRGGSSALLAAAAPRACRTPATGRPDRKATRSAWCSSSGDTVVTIVVRPRRCSASRSAIIASVCASTAEVGSTSTRISGSSASARASTSRCRWPPDSPRPRSSS